MAEDATMVMGGMLTFYAVAIVVAVRDLVVEPNRNIFGLSLVLKFLGVVIRNLLGEACTIFVRKRRRRDLDLLASCRESKQLLPAIKLMLQRT